MSHAAAIYLTPSTTPHGLWSRPATPPTRGGVTFGSPKSARSRRTIALDVETVDALRAHREAQLLERAYAGEAYDDGDLVFADERGLPIHPQRLTEMFTRHRKAAGMPSGTLHVLRHTHATLALTNGVPVHVVAAASATGPKRCCGSTRTCCLPRTSRRPSRWRRCSPVSTRLASGPQTRMVTRGS